MKATSILFISPNPNDATSWYRAWGPFGALKKKNPHINFISGLSKYTWSTFQMTDITFMQRPHTASHLQVAEMAKDNKNKLWVDFDDDLFSVTQDNPAYAHYSQEKIRKNISKIIAMADVVTVSTNYLKRRYEKLNKNIVVVENALNDFLLEDFDPKPFSERPQFFNWRGGPSHERDVLAYTGAILETAETARANNWKWHLIGYNPWFLTERFQEDAVIVSDPLDVVAYHKFMKKLQPTCQVVPLVDNIFNHSKSNIAWLEGTWSGAVTIAPRWEEWDKPGVITYEDEKSLTSAIYAVMAMNEEGLETHLKASQRHIAENYLLSKVNPLREQIIENLLAGRYD